MQKFTFQELKDLFLVAKAPKLGKIGKHQASKKGFRHRVKLSKGEANTKLKIGALRVSGLYLQKLPKYK